jgi:serine O-acetyltransferase
MLNIPFFGNLLSKIFRHLNRCYASCDISPKAIIAKDLKLPHPIGIVIGDGVVIKNNVMIWQHVTLGSHGKKGATMEYPVVEPGSKIYNKATVIGGIHIGQNSTIGAHSLVLIDVPDNATAAGTPARILT